MSEVTGDNRFYCSAAVCVFSSSIGQSNQLCANAKMKRHLESMYLVFVYIFVGVFCVIFDIMVVTKQIKKNTP